ncbi:hypothetical protein E2562_001306, partial [Oryza meyeriana var. granulata]
GSRKKINMLVEVEGDQIHRHGGKPGARSARVWSKLGSGGSGAALVAVMAVWWWVRGSAWGGMAVANEWGIA